jgi:hypothetical protein
MNIVLRKDETGRWFATRNRRLELAAPCYYSPGGLAKWCKNKYPSDKIGVTAKDIGPKTAAITTGPILWLSRQINRWPWPCTGGGL